MPRTVSTVDGTPDARSLSVSLIDVSGDIRTVSGRIAVGALAADIETFVAALAAATNASIYKVSDQMIYIGAESPTNALEAAKSASVFDNVVALFTDVAADRSENVFIPAPIGDLFLGETDNVDPTETAAVTTAWAAIDFGSPTLKSLRYTERREINTRTKV